MKIITLTAIATASLMASSLVDTAKKAGLSPIPDSQLELLKLIDNPKNPITDKKVELGKKLFFDPRLSKSGLISCNTCHNLAEGGDDGLAAAIGHGWTVNPHHLNSPTVYNSVFFESQFWDGRDPHLEKQAQGPILAGPEMAATKEHVVDTVNSMPEYVTSFKKAYSKDVSIDYETITETIATFELKTFIDKGCASCHNGIALGGGMQAFEITAKYKHADLGDFKGDKNGLVKVPTLRNLTQTAPYFHNGGIWSIKEAIVEMGRIQLGMEISDKEATSIETFLKALDGRKPQVIYPILPASTQTTPKPNLH